MKNTLIRTSDEWGFHTTRLRDNKIPQSENLFVDIALTAEFVEFSNRHEKVKGFIGGVVVTLFFVVMLGIIVRLMI